MHFLTILALLGADKPNFEMQYINSCYPNEEAETCTSRQERWHRAMKEYEDQVQQENAQELQYLADDKTKVDPKEGIEAVKPMSPTWCTGETIEPSALRAVPRMLNNFLEARYLEIESLLKAADATCAAPNDAAVKRFTGYIVQAYANLTGQSAADAAAGLAARVKRDEWLKQKRALCEKLKPNPELGGAPAANELVRAKLFGCAGEAEVSKPDEALWTNHDALGVNDVGYYLDSAVQPDSELTRVAWLLSDSWPAEGSDQAWRLFEYSSLQFDLQAFDPAKVLEQLQAEPLAGNGYAKVVLNETLGIVKKNGAALKKQVDQAVKDEGWKQILVTAPQKAWKDWVAQASAHQARLQHSKDFEDKLFGPSLKAAKGCAATLKPDFAAFLKTVKGDSAQALTQAVTADPVGALLLGRLAACEAVEGNKSYAAVLLSTWQRGRLTRGPRLAARYAALEAAGEVKKDRPKFQLEVGNLKMSLPANQDLEQRVRDLTDQTPAGPENLDESVVKSVAKAGGGAKVVFITEKYQVPNFVCQDTNRLYKIDPDGTLRYYRTCHQEGMETITKHVADASFPADLLAGVKGGAVVSFGRVNNSAMGAPSIPIAAYSDKSKKHLTAWLGFSR